MRAGLAAAILLSPADGWAAKGVERLVGAVQAISDSDLPSLASVRNHCGTDTVCAAGLLARAIGPAARLEAVRHLSTDQVRWVESKPSITGLELNDEGVLTIRLTRFGRKAVTELQAALRDVANSADSPLSIIIDLRANPGGDFKRMLRVASLFTGPVPRAVRLTHGGQATVVAIPGGPSPPPDTRLKILVGPETASSAEILAALLKVHADARIIGAKTYGKNYLSRVVPVSHDLRLLVPAERIEIPGARLTGGLVPDHDLGMAGD